MYDWLNPLPSFTNNQEFIPFANDSFYQSMGMGDIFSNSNNTMALADYYIYNSPFTNGRNNNISWNSGNTWNPGSSWESAVSSDPTFSFTNFAGGTDAYMQQGFERAYQMAAYRDQLRGYGYNTGQIEQIINGTSQSQQTNTGSGFDMTSMLTMLALLGGADSGSGGLDITSLFGGLFGGSNTNSSGYDLLSLLNF